MKTIIKKQGTLQGRDLKKGSKLAVIQAEGKEAREIIDEGAKA